MNLDEFLQKIADYADQVAAAEREAEKSSMDVARAMDDMYESKAWVGEWLEQKPEPKRPTNRWDPASRSRFISWQAWKLDEAGRRAPARTRAWTLLEAEKVCKICLTESNLAKPTSEATFRPLFWMRKNRYEERLPEVWAIAVHLAGDDPARVTSKHTREALAQWKKEKFGNRLNGTPRSSQAAITRAANAAAQANRIRLNILDEVKELYRLGGIDEKAQAEFRGLLSDLDAFLDERQVA